MLYTNRESWTYLLHIERILSQHIAFTCLLQAMVSQVECKGSENNFCQSLHHGRIATNRRQQDWHQQSFEKNFCQSLYHGRIEIKRKECHEHLSSMAPLTCELWQDWCSFSFSDLWSQQARIHEELLPQSLFLTCRNCQKTSYQIMYFDHIGSYDELLHLAEVVFNLSILVGRYPYFQFKRLDNKESTSTVRRR